MIGRAIQAMKVDQNAKKRPPKSSKNQMLVFGLCSTSDDQPSNLSDKSSPKCEKRPPKSSKNEMLVFGLHSTSDDEPSDLSNKNQPKCKERSPNSSKNRIFIFGLCSTSDWQSDLSKECLLKCKKRPLSHQKMKCLFLDYVQLLMISQAILAMKVN